MTAVLLVSHGTVERLDDLAAFVRNVRRGRPAPPEVVAELRRRYEAIGGSPLHAINALVARKLEARLVQPVAWASRLWSPYVRDAVADLGRRGVRRVVLVPLAQHSAHVYEADARPAAEEHGVALACVPSWGRDRALCEAFASRIAGALAAVPDVERTSVVLTAHSLPASVVRAGDPYEREVRAAYDVIVDGVSRRVPSRPHFALAYQSQGFSGPGEPPVEWLGPTLREALDEAARRGDRHVVFAPVGFLADHVEILYDIDVEARAMTTERGMTFARTPSLNAEDDFVEVLVSLVQPLLSDGDSAG